MRHRSKDTQSRCKEAYQNSLSISLYLGLGKRSMGGTISTKNVNTSKIGTNTVSHLPSRVMVDSQDTPHSNRVTNNSLNQATGTMMVTTEIEDENDMWLI